MPSRSPGSHAGVYDASALTMKAADGAGSASGSGDDCALHGCSAGATLFSCMSTNMS